MKVDYCGVSTDDMSDALDELGLHDLNWVLEDELAADDVAEALIDLRKALGNRATEHGEAAIAVGARSVMAYEDPVIPASTTEYRQ